MTEDQEVAWVKLEILKYAMGIKSLGDTELFNRLEEFYLKAYERGSQGYDEHLLGAEERIRELTALLDFECKGTVSLQKQVQERGEDLASANEQLADMTARWGAVVDERDRFAHANQEQAKEIGKLRAELEEEAADHQTTSIELSGLITERDRLRAVLDRAFGIVAEPFQQGNRETQIANLRIILLEALRDHT